MIVIKTTIYALISWHININQLVMLLCINITKCYLFLFDVEVASMPVKKA
jgi:hypothetical protein